MRGFFNLNSFADDQPVDIWKIDKKKTEEKSESSITNGNEDESKDSKVYDLQSENNISIIEVDNSVDSLKI